MKFDPKFTSKDNQLFFLDGTLLSTKEVPVVNAADYNGSSDEKLVAVKLCWSEAGLDEDSYNEELLAKLRDGLKLAEEKGNFAFVVPECDSPCESGLQKEAFMESMNHAARRIKDCESVIGFAIPENVDPEEYTRLLLKKHGHYIFFGKTAVLPEIVLF